MLLVDLKESNKQAPSHLSNGTGSLERLVHHEEEEDSTSSTDCLLANDKQNGHGSQHSLNEEENGCIENVLKQVSETMGMKPVATSRYKPASVRQNPQFHERSKSDPPLVDTDVLKLNPQHSFSTVQRPAVRRRPCSSRRKSDFGLRGPVAVYKPPVPYSRTRNEDSTEESRASFELKQNAIYSMQTDGTLEQLSALEALRVEEQWNNQQNFWRRLAIQASSPDTSQKELIQRSTFLVISTLTVGAGVLWGLMYVALGEWTAALMPFIYSTSMSLILFTCICNSSKSESGYDTFVECQLALILILPFAVHVALGGVEKSGAVMLWSFLCPMGAAFFRSSKASLRWYGLYMSISAILLVKGFWDVSNDDTMTMIDENVIRDERGIDSTTRSSSSSETIQKLYFLMNIIGVKCVIFAAVYLFAQELEKEYTKSEEVLRNILPSTIVKRIKRGEFPIIDHVAGVTILFADLVGFTKASTELHPNFLIGLFLRDIFHEFDELSTKHGLEKIKTIGDAYMVVGGLNHGEKLSSHSINQSAEYKNQKPHATNTMFFAMDMFEALKKVNQKYNLKFDLRIGVHTGPVVAGVLGLKRFTYDVWGDSVNTASRMESNGVPGLIHMSSEMHQAVGGMTNVFDFSCCGKINIKGKGDMTTFLAQPLLEEMD